jgi:hypothetical protein
VNKTLKNRLGRLEQAPPRGPRRACDLTDEELLQLFDQDRIETPYGLMLFCEADAVSRWRHIEAIAGEVPV